MSRVGSSRPLLEGSRRLTALFRSSKRVGPLADVARSLPVSGEATGFELRLGDQAAVGGLDVVDLGMLLLPNSATRIRMKERPCGPALDSEAWSRVATFVARWLEPGSLLSRRVPLVFLEFDCPDGAGTPVAPCVFVRLPLPWEIDEPVDAATTLETVDAALGLLLGQDPDRTRTIESVLSRMPADCHPLHVGAMSSRRDRVRLFTGLPAPRLSDTLLQLDLGRYVDAAEIVTEALDPTADWCQLQFDVGSPQPRIGLEFNRTSTCPEEAPHDWSELLGRLEEAGWCTEPERTALLAWPGREVVADRTLLFELSHVKIALGPGQATAKAYVSQRWIH